MITTSPNGSPSGPASQRSRTSQPGRLSYGQRGRSLPMDMLRAVAILLVLGRHYVVAPENLGWLQPLAAAWTTIGWAGVDLFFVLSGFLVSGLIFAEYRQCGRVDIRRFVIRRGFKIWPPYLVFVAVIAVWLAWQHTMGKGSGVWTQLWPNVFHVQNYFHTPRVHTWSLAVEEHFYLAAAFAFAWVLGRRDARAALRRLPAVIGCCVAGLAALRHEEFLRFGGAHLNLYATHLRFDGLLIGTLLAYWTHFEPERLAPLTRHPVLLMVVGGLLATPTLALSPEASAWTAGIGLTGVYAGFGLLMLGWLNVANARVGWRRMCEGRVGAVLGHIGFYSYSIYLWHVDLAQTPIKKVVSFAGESGWPPALVWTLATTVYVVMAVITGAVLARWLEIPSLALRDRLFPSAVKPVAVASGAEAPTVAAASHASAATPVTPASAL